MQAQTLAQFTERKVSLPSGLELAYATRGASSGRALLFLHGFIDSWHSFAPMAEFLPQEWQLISVDLRGHGRSSKPQASYDLQDYTADIAALCDTLNIGQAVIVGQSLGSMVAQRLAALRPDLPEALFLIGSSAGSKDNAVLASVLDLCADLTDPIPRAFVEEIQQFSDPVPDDVWQDAVSETLRVPLHVWREGLKGLLRADNRPLMANIKCPVSIVWGVNDGVFERAEQVELCALLPQAKFKAYENAGHSIQWQKPQDLVRDLLELCNKGG